MNEIPLSNTDLTASPYQYIDLAEEDTAQPIRRMQRSRLDSVFMLAN